MDKAMRPSNRDKQIIELRTRGVTLEAIGQRFGITRERVRQILSRHEITRRFSTQADLMDRFGVDWYEISQAMKGVGLSHKPGQRRWYAFSDADVAKIEQHLQKRAVRACVICGSPCEGRRGKRFCSPQCFRQYRRQRRGSSEQTMRPTTRRIQEILAAEPPGRYWVTLKEAALLSGLSRMQLSWLRLRGIIACVPSGKRGRLYSARHCEVLRRLAAQG
jgi:hypothetical protein